MKPLERSSLAGTVAENLRQAILDGQFRPGDRVSDADVASQLDVSRTPVREAIRVLVAQGLLAEEPGRGVKVRAFGPDDLRDVCELRLALETVAIGRLAEQATPEAVAELRTLVDAMRSEPAAPRLAELDSEFHVTLCTLCGNDRLVDLYRPLSLQVRLQMVTNFSATYDAATMAEQHALLVAPIAARDPDAARAAIREHLEWAARLLREAMPEPAA